MVNKMIMKKKLYDFLVEKARNKELVTYGEVADHLGVDLSNVGERYNEFAQLMGNLNKDMIAEGKPLISSIIILKNKNPLAQITPGEGFFEFAKKYGVMKPREDKQLFWAKETKKVFEEWKDE